MTRLHTPGGVRPPTDVRAVAAACLGVALAAATTLSAPHSAGGPQLSAAVPPSPAGQVEDVPSEGNGLLRSRGAPPAERAGEARGQAAAERAEPVDINRADASALQRLPGVGPVLAERIIRYRETHGAFGAPEDLLDVPGIGATRYARLRPLVRTADAP